jgi:hypothetical protein
MEDAVEDAAERDVRSPGRSRWLLGWQHIADERPEVIGDAPDGRELSSKDGVCGGAAHRLVLLLVIEDSQEERPGAAACSYQGRYGVLG